MSVHAIKLEGDLSFVTSFEPGKEVTQTYIVHGNPGEEVAVSVRENVAQYFIIPQELIITDQGEVSVEVQMHLPNQWDPALSSVSIEFQEKGQAGAMKIGFNARIRVVQIEDKVSCRSYAQLRPNENKINVEFQSSNWGGHDAKKYYVKAVLKDQDKKIKSKRTWWKRSLQSEEERITTLTFKTNRLEKGEYTFEVKAYCNGEEIYSDTLPYNKREDPEPIINLDNGVIVPIILMILVIALGLGITIFMNARRIR